MIQIKIDKLTSDLETLKTAMGEFEPYSKDFMKQCISDLEGQNSDFVETVKDTLMSIADTKAPKLLEKINFFHKKGINLVRTFKETEEDIAKNIKLNKVE
ncbi:hypothetical protein NNC19_13390 [Clostridium sp. SHJSY1]|uniref:hypothetical protein n=1 Tax=Clostridium sp. SHJSY1 TaxID=2942483 RepID=UPI0028754A01|nr:hypothetical protein [Clostridium sp. SHJSY1]MDS0526680.1 hypothetical protein [Clostridium sp. SHJSY1]